MLVLIGASVVLCAITLTLLLATRRQLSRLPAQTALPAQSIAADVTRFERATGERLAVLTDMTERDGEWMRDALVQLGERAIASERLHREELTRGQKSMAQELAAQLINIADRLAAQMRGQSQLHDKGLTQTQNDLTKLAKHTAESLGQQQQMLERRLNEIRDVVDRQLLSLRESNESKLEEMRATVDEKLQGALERRLGESFKNVSERLEQVHRGLGEMQKLAVGVGDLKKVMTNVKTRGTWGEVQLVNLLEQLLAPSQYGTNIATRPDCRDRVECAIRLPGNDDKSVWLPIDAKFPQEDYLRLRDAREAGDVPKAKAARKQLFDVVKASAARIREKYVEPPYTTDFAILFVPTEGLYAELASAPALLETLQRQFRIMVAGPSNLAALVNSLQLGFRTLAIQQRSSEVWDVLAGVKTEFRKFGDILTKVETKLSQAQRVIGDARRRERAMNRSLRTVDELPADDKQQVLKLHP